MNSKLETYWKAFFVLVVCLFIVAAIVITQGCSSTEHRRQQLQEEHPDCWVFEDLTLECPDPFDSSAGFGMGIQNEKPKKKKK